MSWVRSTWYTTTRARRTTSLHVVQEYSPSFSTFLMSKKEVKQVFPLLTLLFLPRKDEVCCGLVCWMKILPRSTDAHYMKPNLSLKEENLLLIVGSICMTMLYLICGDAQEYSTNDPLTATQPQHYSLAISYQQKDTSNILHQYMASYI